MSIIEKGHSGGPRSADSSGLQATAAATVSEPGEQCLKYSKPGATEDHHLVGRVLAVT